MEAVVSRYDSATPLIAIFIVGGVLILLLWSIDAALHRIHIAVIKSSKKLKVASIQTNAAILVEDTPSSSSTEDEEVFDDGKDEAQERADAEREEVEEEDSEGENK